MTHILVVEDEKYVAEFILQTIKYSFPSASTIWASNGSKALRLLQQHAFDVLITDFRLPGLSGLSLIEQSREINPDLLIVLATAFATPDIENRITSLKINAYLQKPFTVDKLTMCLNALLPNSGQPVSS